MVNIADFVERKMQTLPYGGLYTAAKSIPPDASTLCDLGCGEGKALKNILGIRRAKKLRCVGTEIFYPSLIKCKRLGIYDDLINSDIKSLPFTAKSFDVVFCSHVIEHLVKEDAMTLLARLETMSRHTIVVLIPNGYQEQEEIEGNPWQKHLSTWSPTEFTKLGYSVYGYNFNRLCGDKYRRGEYSSIRRLIATFFSLLLSPLSKKSYNLAENLICVKILDGL